MVVDFVNYCKLLEKFVSFKTVSTDAAYKSEIADCVAWLSELFAQHEFSVTIEVSSEGNPVIIARKVVSPKFRTILVYGHYDVQPAKKSDGWDSEPFKLTERKGKFYGRGVVDNKGQILSHMVSVFSLLKSGKLSSNVVFVIEGNEETGGGSLAKLLRERTKLFACDVVLVSDGEMPYSPVIEASYRGCFNLELKLTTANSALHSGIYGGAVPSASQELIRLLSLIHDKDGRVTIPHFYDGDVVPNSEQLKDCKKMDKLRADMLLQTGLKKYDFAFSSKTGFSSMIEISGVNCGYTGEGFCNIVPHIATAKINVRLAGHSDPQTVAQSIIDYLSAKVLPFASIEFSFDAPFEEMAAPVYLDITTDLYRSTIDLLKQVYGKEVSINYCGATIPIVSDFISVLGVELLSVPLGNDDCNMHGANENLDVELAKLGLKFSERFFGK